MSFVSPDSMTNEDFPTSSISISVSSLAIGDIASVTATSSSDDLCQEQEHAINSTFLDISPVKKRKVQHRTRTTTSWIWNHFKKIDNKTGFALCQICLNKAYYTLPCWSGMLDDTIRKCIIIILKPKPMPNLYWEISSSH
jgi:hypothetical protein